MRWTRHKKGKLLDNFYVDILVKDIFWNFVTFKGANVNDQNKDGYSALMGASAMGHFRIVTFLGEKGANITSRNDYQDTSLILAARNNHLPVVQYLVVSLICYENKKNQSVFVKVRIFWEGHKIWKNLPLKIWRY